MKLKKLLFLSAMILISGTTSAQNLVIDNFELGKVSFTEALNVNPENSGKFEVVANPASSNVNNSKKCLKYTRLHSGENWAGFWSMLKTPFNTSGYKYLHVKYYRGNSESQLRVLFEGDGFKQEFMPMEGHAPTATNKWENLVFDLEASGVANKQVTVFGFQPDFCSPNNANTIVYIDEVTLSTSITGDDGFSSYIPKGLNVENVQISSLNLKWDAVKDAKSYEIYKDDVLLTSTSITNLDIQNLEEFEPYKFHIIAKNANGENSLPSNPIYVQTLESKQHKDERMAWWREARFGMFIHWGGYAAFAGHYEGLKANGEYINYDSAGSGNGGYAEWIMFGAQIPRNVYKQKVATDFTAKNYKPEEWVRMAKEAGMKYIIITSKHHEGLAMFNTNVGWNVISGSAANKDLMRGLVDAARKEGIKIGFYYSQALDWMNPGGMDWMPQNNNGNGGEWPYEDQKKYVNELVIPHLNTILNDYKVDVIWFDMGQSDYPDLQYATLKAIKQNPNSKNIIYNNRLEFKIDNGYSGDFETPEQSIPDVPVTGRGDNHDWETCMTMNINWGYCEKDNNWKSTNELISKLIDIASKGGNFLLNVGPKADGTFPQESIDRLSSIGKWMKVNGEAIYGTSANPIPKVIEWGKTTRKFDKDDNAILYLHVAKWPENGEITVPLVGSTPTEISILGMPEASLKAQAYNNDLILKGLPANPQNKYSTTIKLVFKGDIKINEAYIYPNKDNVLTLLPDDATVEGICIEGDQGMRNLGCWAAESLGPVTGKKAEWKIYVPVSDSYNVISKLGSVGGGQLNIAIDGIPTADLNYSDIVDYHEEELGSIDLKEGFHTLTLTRTSTTANWNYVNLLSLSFISNNFSGGDVIQQELNNIRVHASEGLIFINGLHNGDIISIYNILGQCFMRKNANNGIYTLNLGEKGTWIVKVTSSNGYSTTKKITL